MLPTESIIQKLTFYYTISDCQLQLESVLEYHISDALNCRHCSAEPSDYLNHHYYVDKICAIRQRSDMIFNFQPNPFSESALNARDPWQKNDCQAGSNRLIHITYTCEEDLQLSSLSDQNEINIRRSVYIQSVKGLYEQWKTNMIFNKEIQDMEPAYSSNFCKIVFDIGGSQYYIGGPGSLFYIANRTIGMENIGSIVNIAFRKGEQNHMIITPYIMDNLVRQSLRVREGDVYHLYYQTTDSNIQPKFVIKIGGKLLKTLQKLFKHMFWIF